MAAGCVVLASDTVPHREVITPGQTGLLVDGRDTDGLARQALAVLADLARYRPLGDAAAAMVREQYAQDVCLPRLAERFTALVAAGGRKAVNVLFIHDAFPAQFGRLALELTRRHGWRCSFLVQSLSSCPTPSREMLEALELHKMPLAAEHRSSDGIPVAPDLRALSRAMPDRARRACAPGRACVPT